MHSGRTEQFKVGALLLAALMLTACGGGGGDDSVTINGQPSSLRPCSVGSAVVLSAAYEVAGQIYGRDAIISLPTGQAMLATPRIQGLPSECENSVHWTFSHNTVASTRLSFNATTGVVSGTPRAGDYLEVTAHWLVVGNSQTGSGLFRFLAR